MIQNPHVGYDSEKRKDDHHYWHAHGRHETRLNYLVAWEYEASQDISGRGADKNQQDTGNDGVYKRVPKDSGHIGIYPCLYIVFKMEPGG